MTTVEPQAVPTMHTGVVAAGVRVARAGRCVPAVVHGPAVVRGSAAPGVPPVVGGPAALRVSPVLRLLVLAAALAWVPAGAAAEEAGPYRLGPPPAGPPQRVVTLAPSLTEAVIALGAADRLVGVSRYDAFPEVRGVARVGGYLDPNLEAILGLRPDLLVVEPSPGNQAVVERLAAMGVAVRVAPSRSVAGVRATLTAIAGDLGLPEEGARLVARLDAALARVRAAATGRPAPRVLLVYGHEPLVVAGPGSFGDELLRLVGARNAASDTSVPYPSYPLERVAAARPDVIVDVVAHGAMDARPRLWTRLESLARARVVRLDASVLLRPGPALGEGARRLFEAVHPGATVAASAAPHDPAAPLTPEAATP